MGSKLAVTFPLTLALVACGPDQPTSTIPGTPSFAVVASEDSTVSPVLAAMNDQLAAVGSRVRVHHAEWIVQPDSGALMGQVVFADDRSHRTGIKWVPGDPRRGATGDEITYLVDESDGVATGAVGQPSLTNAQTEAALDRTFATWNNATCNKLSVIKVPDPGTDPDITDELIFGGPLGTPASDITEAGWVGRAFFDALTPNGSRFILAVTFSFFFVDDGTPTDINHDGFFDAAIAEVYYNNRFRWGINTFFPPVDVESVALHENGHTLGLDHFGKIFRTVANGELHFAPRAVMNAAFVGDILHTLTGTDDASLCSLYASWPH